MISIENYILGIPKAELHLHIEGSFEPELMFAIAKRNKIDMPYESVEQLKKAYQFDNLQSFLDIYYQGASVLITEEDFFDLTWVYLSKAQTQNIVHTEIFFDPQTHTKRGIPFKTVIEGITKAMEKAKEELGISSYLIMSFLRHLSEQEAFDTLKEAAPFYNKIYGIGLDSSELGNPPEKFQQVFAKCKELGFKLMAHAGEEGPAKYVNDSIDLLKIDRIDHGNRCLDDRDLVEKIKTKNLALTVCPLSNYKLKVVDNLKNHPLKTMLDLGLRATINSDDPAYFGGYINENYIAIAKYLELTRLDIKQLAVNSIEASFLPFDLKQYWIQEIENYHKNHQ